ncbi:protein kinase domain-containing protein [Dermacoccaceae bacterium W4C1]
MGHDARPHDAGEPTSARSGVDPAITTAAAQRAGHRLPGGRVVAPEREDVTAEMGTMLGPYLLVDRLGEGGMGVVHKGVDRDGREVAVKVLRPHIAHDSTARDRLRREVHTLSRVRHDHVAPVLDADVDGPAPYLVTSYVPGPPLDEVVDQQGPLQPAQLVTLGRGLAEALKAIHAAGVIHRDVKPGNVLMVGDDPTLIDFGIAHVADDVRLTMTGLVMGTPGYLSPEVVEGSAVDEATDWWGWAATLAFAASGQSPFGRGPMPVILDRVTRGEPDLSGVDERLRPLLASALSPIPAERPSADQVLTQLEAYAAGGTTTGIPTTGRRGSPDEGRAPNPTQGTPATPATRVQPVNTPRTEQFPAAEPEPAQWAGAAAPEAQPQHSGTAARGWAAGPAPVGFEDPSRGQAAQPQVDPRPAQPGPDARSRAAGPGQPDPRIGRDSRTGTLAALAAALIGVAALRPAWAVFLLVVWSIAARWTDRSMTAMVRRRYTAGQRRSDGVVAALASPWHGCLALLATVFALILPLLVALCAAVTTALAISLGTGGEADLQQSPPWIVGGLLAIWVSWWGPGGTSLRRGSRSLVRGALRTTPVTRIVAGLCIAVGVVGVALSLSAGVSTSLSPFSLSSTWSLNDWFPSGS